MKKTLIVFVFFVICFSSVFAGKRPIIYVAAMAGLSLRAEPSAKSERLELLPYGTKITNYNDTGRDTIIDGYRGPWLRVALNGKDGYIFGGYTLPVIPPTSATGTLKNYLVENFGEPVSRDSFICSEGEKMKTITHKKSLIYQEYYGFMMQHSILNLNMTIQEAYLMFYLLDQNLPNLFEVYEAKKTIPLKFPKQEKDSYRVEEVEISLDNCITLKFIAIHNHVIVSWYECV